MTKTIIYIALLLAFFESYAQREGSVKMTDEQFSALQDKAKSHINSTIDSTFYYVGEIEKSGNPVHKAGALATKAYALAKQNKFSEAEKNYVRAIKLVTDAPVSSLKSKTASYVYNISGLIHWMKEELPQALDDFFMAKKIAVKDNDIVQINKISQNIANIKRDIGNYREAILCYKESDKIVDSNKSMYPHFDYLQNKANLNFNLGICYEEYFSKNRGKSILLDSAFYYYNKALLYSKDNLTINLNTLKNIGNIHFFRHNFLEAEKSYLATAALAKQNNAIKEYYGCMYNLGLVNYSKKSYDKALVYFIKVDSIYRISDFGKTEYIDSNYKQAKIFEIKKDYDKALLHSEIYIENFEDKEAAQQDNIIEATYKFSNLDLKKEMIDLQQKYSNRILFKNFFVGFLIIFILVLIILYVRKDRSKKAVEKKFEAILTEFNAAGSHKTIETDNRVDYVIAEKNEPQLLSADNENDILARLKALEEKKYYLKADFTQQLVAKKIKTNTTYLSYVVNKHYNKSFSMYYNELRINYIINEIIGNATFREYTTQAIAESAGFKNADSFTTSFKKKTGLTPFQFINQIKKKGI